ncbi:hypothetical protein BGZ63DRAFT_412719 [Mariannaea sp. PMI_226]|nr:hypothetical protein BGZ63DRAFT_412719 [Mariannaea sp. PMI_226]
MSNYDPYERDYSRHHTREDRETRYYDPRDSRDSRDVYTKTQHRELIPRAREDSEYSVEEVRRDFPPPTGRELYRARSRDGRYEDEYEYQRSYDPRHEREYERRSRRSPGSSHHDSDDRKHKHKGMSKNEKIIAAVAGAALLAGGKELYDRREAKEEGTEIQRNPLSSLALAGVGALAAYQGAQFYSKQQAKKDQKANLLLQHGRDIRYDDYYSDDDEPSRERKGHKNFLESALAATGLGAVVKTLTGSDSRSDTRSRGPGSVSSRSQSRGGANKIQKAAMASLLAGATEAFRVAKEPGSWKGEKTKRILTAAAGAATIDTATDPKHSKLGIAESVIGGLVGNRLINGSRNDIEEDKVTGRSRSRSRARSKGRDGGGGVSGLAALATAGLGALGAKKVLDHSRSRSRSRSHGHRGRDDSYSPERRRERSRSRSIVDRTRNSLAKLGFGSGTGAAVDEHRRRDQDDYSEHGSHRSRRHDDDDYDDRRHGTRDYYDDERSYRSKHGDRSSRRDRRDDYSSESDLGDSSEDEKRARKMKGKQIVTTGLAAVATIHAAHEVYQSMEKRKARQKAVAEGVLSERKAKKMKTKAVVQDAASVGIAALGIKSAFQEMKEAKHMTHECREFKAEKARRHERRRQRRLEGSSDGRERATSWTPLSRARHDGYDSDNESDPGFYQGHSPRFASGTAPIPPVGGNW